MADITTYKPLSIKDMMLDIRKYATNPAAIQRVILTFLDNVVDGKVDVVDPTNPFVFALESSAVNTAAAVMESHLDHKKTYPSLSQSYDDLYRHMSDKDYVDVFATPTETTVTFMVQHDTLQNAFIEDNNEGCYKVALPKNTEVTVNDFVFSFNYQVFIRKYYSGAIELSYDTSEVSELALLETNIIKHEIVTDSNLVSWLKFDVPVMQYRITTEYFNIQSSEAFRVKMEYVDKFYYCRVFHKVLDVWEELKVTHTEQVYDHLSPTAVLQVGDNIVSVHIPTTYVNSGQVTGEIRVDVYSTLGEMNVSLSNYTLGSFSVNLKTIDEVNDYTPFVDAFAQTSHYAFSDKLVSGGRDKLSFAELRERVMLNAVGPRILPITPVQLITRASDLGFDLIQNIDVLTNRVYLASKRLPTPSNEKLITPANLSIATARFTIEELTVNSNVKSNGKRHTILPTALYSFDNAVTTLCTDIELNYLKQLGASRLCDAVNKKQYLHTPYYYVIDTNNEEFDVRIYDLDQPKSTNINFKKQNVTTKLRVNTYAHLLEKTHYGYRLLLQTSGDTYYKKLPDQEVSCYLVYTPVGESSYAYIEATLLTKVDEERIFEFQLQSNLDIDEGNNLYITNGKLFNRTATKPISLSHNVSIVYTTTSIPTGFVRSAIDDTLSDAPSLVPVVGITHETLQLVTGYHLDRLWKNSRSFSLGTKYRTHEGDVPARYSQNVFDINPDTKTIFTFNEGCGISYNLIGRKGDVITDADGNLVYDKRKGDLVLDEHGSPIPIADGDIVRYIDMLMIDGAYYFASDSIYKLYRRELVQHVNKWVLEDLPRLKLLEKTKAYFHPNKTLSVSRLMVRNGEYITVDSAQRMKLELFVKDSVNDNTKIKEAIEKAAKTIVNNMLGGSIVSITKIEDALMNAFGESVVSLRLSGLCGASNLEVVVVEEDGSRLSLAKELENQADGTTIVKEALEFIYTELM